MKKITLLFCFLLLSSLHVWAVPSEAPAAAAPQTSPAWSVLWKQAKELETKGEHSKARETYETLLNAEGLPQSGRSLRSIRKEYERLRMKILFSPTVTSESLVHTVIPGDTLSEIASKYGTTAELLRKSNKISKDLIYPEMKLKVNKLNFSVVVSKKKNQLTLLAGGKPFKTYRVATGTGNSTPEGTFKIVNKLKDPAWFHVGAVVSPGSPENILGTRWMGFDLAGYGIHGTTLPGTIGTQASKGCIRMLNEEVEELYAVLPLKTSVAVEP